MSARSADNTPLLLMLLAGGTYIAYRAATGHGITLPTFGNTGAPTLPATATATPNANANAAPSAALAASAPAPGRSATDPRGIRNNNPTNIVYSAQNKWVGQIGSDGTFAKFNTAVDGLRAAFVLLKTYVRNYGADTIARIAARWAPAPANNPANYAATVGRIASIGVNVKISPTDAQQMIRIVRGMIVAENGAAYASFYSDGDLMKAYAAS